MKMYINNMSFVWQDYEKQRRFAQVNLKNGIAFK